MSLLLKKDTKLNYSSGKKTKVISIDENVPVKNFSPENSRTIQQVWEFAKTHDYRTST